MQPETGRPEYRRVGTGHPRLASVDDHHGTPAQHPPWTLGIDLEGGTLVDPHPEQRRPLIMVVDDSLTVRKITSRLLQREGFDVVTAKDGIDALQVLSEQTPDVILLDIEMPRMDGFEFTKTIKADAKHSHVPIIMITSRTAEKHRNLARELGVDLYLGKPYQEEDLLRSLREMLELV